MKTCNRCGRSFSKCHVNQRECKPCISIRSREYYQRNRERCIAYQAVYRKENQEEVKRRRRGWYHENREQQLDYKREYYRRNQKECLERSLKWQRDNPGKARARNALRKARKLQATPRWVDLKEIEKFYEEAHQLTESTGIKYEVDHIIPLVHADVSGLHVPWNLQIITKEENLRKSNSFSPQPQPGALGQFGL